MYSYRYEDGKPCVCRDKVIETANIFTMNCPKDWMEKFNYPALLESNTETLKTVFGASETLYSCDTYQFTDYSSTSPTPALSEGALSKKRRTHKILRATTGSCTLASSLFCLNPQYCLPPSAEIGRDVHACHLEAR